MEFFQNLIALIGSGMTIIGGIVALIIGYYFGRKPPPEELEAGADLREQVRIAEAKKELARQESAERWNRRIAGSLTVGQYIIGAALASAFIQASMPEYSVGFLGVIVLLSQVIQQRFRPDLRSLGARERGTFLRKLIRDAEDALFANETKLKEAPATYKIRLMVSRGLAEVDRLETEELTMRMRAQKEPQSVEGEA